MRISALIVALCATFSRGADPIVQTAKDWLNAAPSARGSFESALAGWTGDIDAVIEQVRPRGKETATGEVFFQDFRIPRFAQKYKNHQFHLHIPTHYTPDKPFGILFNMHGGGSPMSDPVQENAWVAHNVMHKWEGGKRSYARPEVDTSNFILVGPIAPFGPLLLYPQHASRWDVPAADQYLMDIVTEIAQRYNVDYDRVVISGFSMGGIGAYHQAVRLADRIAAAHISAGSWRVIAWDAMKYTPVFLHHGAQDAYWNSPSDFRWHGTDVAFARMADALLTGYGVTHRYWEYPGNHGWDDIGEKGWKEFIDGQGGWVADKRRDAYRSGVIALDRWRSYDIQDNGGTPWNEDPSPHTLWVSINTRKPGTIRYDYARAEGGAGCSMGSCSETAFQSWKLNQDSMPLEGARVDANITGPNTIVLTTQNVATLSLWLHPKMVDVTKPVSVSVNGTVRSYTCTPSLLDALRSYERREDWQMIYHCEVLIDASGTACTPSCGGKQCGQDGCGGWCGTCAQGNVCLAGSCATSCAAGQAACGATCVDLTVDRDHCGACGTVCPGASQCVAGQCLGGPASDTGLPDGGPKKPAAPGGLMQGGCGCDSVPALLSLAGLLWLGALKRRKRC